MTFLATAILASVVALAPIGPAATVDLSSLGSQAADVAWLNDDEVLVALTKGGIAKVSAKTKQAARWMPNGPLPTGSPYPELVATDGTVVVIVGGSLRHAIFRSADGKYLFGYHGGPLNARGLAVSGGKAFMMGWLTKAGTNADQQRGALFSQSAPDPLVESPIHRVLSSTSGLERWRLTAFPYGGASVALPDGSIAIITSAEPGVFRYDRNGRLVEVLGSGVDALVVDSLRMVQSYADNVEGRYTQLLNRQAAIDDLVVTPAGLAILVRIAARGSIGWELWNVGSTDVIRRQPLATTRLGPFGHMKCEGRGVRLACVANFPGTKDASQPQTAGANPRLFFYRLTR